MTALDASAAKIHKNPQINQTYLPKSYKKSISENRDAAFFLSHSFSSSSRWGERVAKTFW
jgi:hypothetical protein